jgi:adenine/guanine phosphoribosyltransferase-like PRPP-binding protein
MRRPSLNGFSGGWGHHDRTREVWQEILPRGTIAGSDTEGYGDTYPARLPDGREIAFPVRVLPGDGTRAVASLILNQASFAVEDALADAVADRARTLGAEVVVAVPTLGLGLGNAVARRLGHGRMVALGTSAKFWYDDTLSVPVTSITSPTIPKRLYLDPRTVAAMQDRRVLLVDDVLSTGKTCLAALALLARAGLRPSGLAFAMRQGSGGAAALAAAGYGDLRIVAAVDTPRLALRGGRWFPETA